MKLMLNHLVQVLRIAAMVGFLAGFMVKIAMFVIGL